MSRRHELRVTHYRQERVKRLMIQHGELRAAGSVTPWVPGWMLSHRFGHPEGDHGVQPARFDRLVQDSTLLSVG
jgi:hypothetical protein